MICIPELDRCGAGSGTGHDRHWCALPAGHVLAYPLHTCGCGRDWLVDLEGELAAIAYRAFNTVPYLDAPEIPNADVVAAGSAPGTPMRRTVAAVLAYLGIQP